MTEVMKHAIDLDEKTINETEERLQSLLVENQGLKELLRIKSRYGNSDNNNNSNKSVSTTTLNKEVQTDPSQEEVVKEQTSLVPPFNLSEDASVQKSVEMSAIEVQTDSTMDLDLPNINGKLRLQDYFIQIKIKLV